MIQDIAPHRLDNIYDPARKPGADSLVVHFSGRNLLCSLSERKQLRLPDYETFCRMAAGDGPYYYLFSLDRAPVFLAAFDGSFGEGTPFSYSDINLFRSAEPKEMAYAAVTAYHLSVWYRSNRFCGCCGARTVHDSAERMMRCPECGNMIFPKIMPSVIVAVVNGDRILLTRYNRPGSKLGALVAGFTEIGESVEDTVRREVMEECGLKVKDLVFYKTQPWGISGGGLLVGFWCRPDGDDTIHVDGVELAEGRWVSRSWLLENYKDAGIALTGEMISRFAHDPQFIDTLF